jgi:parallel beta-helix repeat protein
MLNYDDNHNKDKRHFSRLLLVTVAPLSLFLILLLLPSDNAIIPEVNIMPTNAAASTLDIAYAISPSAAVLSSTSNENCISYDSSARVITIRCKSASVTDLDNQINDDSILTKQSSNGIWLLDAGILVDKGAVLNIDSSDVKWLRIAADGTSVNAIDVLGGLRIDSVKLTSWNPNKNDYASSNGTRDLHDNKVVNGDPRPYIRVDDEATGTTNITNSEIAYLGYESGVGGGKTGLRYDGGSGSILIGNNIHNLYFGFYSSGVGGMIIENNQIHHNSHYGFDPHTGTHDMIFRNNTVHDNGGIGFICSLDCHHIVIEKNKIYDNAKRGIMFSRNMSDSIARNNIIDKEEHAITISESHNNEIYNNRISNSEGGIDIDKESSNNAIHNNTIIVADKAHSQVQASSSSDAISVEEGAEKNNKIYSNTIINDDSGKNVNQ